MEFDSLLLSRFQFAFTIMFHYLFPPLTIGLGVILVGIEGMYLKTKDPQYEAMAKFWTKIFAITFAMGVVTGIVMEFEFGTNWAAYSRYVGDVFGSALAAEGIFAFFLESGFLAILVFGWDKVSSRMHFFATVMVSLGSIFSSIWIVVANSWMQTPTGYVIVGEGLTARAEITSFWAVVFNPSTIPRLLHVWDGALILGGFFVLSISSYYILKERHLNFAYKTFKIALVITTIASLLALGTGHLQADNVAHYQPAKLAAYEGHYQTGSGTLYLFGFPSDEDQTVSFGLGIPGGLSFLIHWSFTEPVVGLTDFPPDEWPNVAVVFQTYHIMVALGMFFIALTLSGCFFWWRGSLFQQRWLLQIYVFAVGGAVLANQLGWVSAEMGRQPWIVYGLLRTDEAVSESITAGMVMSSIIMFGLIYLLLFVIWIYVLNNKIQHGPEMVREN
ncbi:cytochrome ubiquinol oxidase subunit I [Anaerolineales bacterium HSG24]|nr:cytochrome ubiquinol oxidase subunit I [Anaerolineales bacterium HSG24]